MEDNQNSQNLKKEYDSRREQKEREREARERKKKVLRVFRWAAILVGMFLLVMLLAKLAAPKPGSNVPTQADAVTDQDWTRGSRQAKVTLIEYADFQCPACGAYHPIVKELEKEFGDRLLVVYRNFPLSQIHNNARPAAFAAGAAGLQGKFWEMHDKIFENQRAWSDLADPMAEFSKYAQDIGLDVERFKQDMRTKVVTDKVNADYAGGQNAGVNSTPTFFINGTKIENPRGYESFKKILDQVFQIAGQ